MVICFFFFFFFFFWELTLPLIVPWITCGSFLADWQVRVPLYRYSGAGVANPLGLIRSPWLVNVEEPTCTYAARWTLRVGDRPGRVDPPYAISSRSRFISPNRPPGLRPLLYSAVPVNRFVPGRYYSSLRQPPSPIVCIVKGELPPICSPSTLQHDYLPYCLVVRDNSFMLR
jgi:hypothetical protein